MRRFSNTGAPQSEDHAFRRLEQSQIVREPRTTSRTRYRASTKESSPIRSVHAADTAVALLKSRPRGAVSSLIQS